MSFELTLKVLCVFGLLLPLLLSKCSHSRGKHRHKRNNNNSNSSYN